MSSDSRRKSAVLVLACALLVCAFAAWSGAAPKQEPSPYADEEYKELMDQRVGDIYDLEAWAAAVQDYYLPILPPAPDLILKQPGMEEVLPFDFKSFPPGFKDLAGVYENSVPVYPILVVEDPKTRALTFYNMDNKALYTLPAPPGYDPFAYLKDRWPGLFNGGANEAARNYMRQLFDPARIQVRAKMIESDKLALWIYTKRRIEEAQAQQAGEGDLGMMMFLGGAPNSNLFFTVVKRATNYVSMTIQYPSGFTNGLDVFTCSDLMAETWDFAAKNLTTTGTNVTWVDTNAWVVGGFPTRLYAATDATTDGDGDGYLDGRELMVYSTDPMSASSHPVSVSGSVSYGGIETGGVYVLFTQVTGSWSIAKSIWQASPGAYTNNEIGNGQSWWFKAFRDANGNFALDEWEARGTYSGASTLVTGNLAGVNIAMADVPSIWGQINYGGTAAGDIHVIAVTSSNSWDETYSTTIPYVQAEGMSGEQYYVSFPVDFRLSGLPASNYWIRAYMDTDTNGVPSSLDPAGQHSTNSIPVSNRVTGVNVTVAYDSDGDGLPDWWEMTHWGNLAQGGGGDSDGDGVTNSAEYALNADPNLADTDGDGLSDLLESQLGTAANVANAIVDVAPSEVCITGRQQAVTLGKFTLFPQYSEPGQTPTNPVYFLNESVTASTGAWDGITTPWEGTGYAETLAVDVVVGTYDFASFNFDTYALQCGGGFQFGLTASGHGYDWDFDPGTGNSNTFTKFTGWGCTSTNGGAPTNVPVAHWSLEDRRQMGEWTNHSAGMSNIVITLTNNISSVLMQSSNQGNGWTYIRSMPHTTTQLLLSATGCLSQLPPLALTNINWGEQKRYDPPGGYMPHGGGTTTLAAVNRAYRDLAGDETSVSLERLQYRIEKASTVSGVVYRATVLHLFTPEGASTSAVAHVTNLWAKGVGGAVVFMPTNGVTIEPPGQDGAIAPVVLKVELFRDEACTSVLDDWPAENGKPRSPKYLFGAENDVFVKITGPAGLGNSCIEVLVSSESDTTGIPISLREVASGVYRNDAADGELLRLKNSSSQSSPADFIKVVDEEVLTFKVTVSGGEICSTDVEVDRIEIGVEWQSDYDTYDPMSGLYSTLHTADDFAAGVYDYIGEANLIWFKNFNGGDLNSQESHFAAAGDTSWADAVDMVVWCGHGPSSGPHLRFFVDLVGGLKQSPDQLIWGDIAWGDTDADWVILNTCNFLNGTDSQLQTMVAGVHLICGYATDMTVFAAAGDYFADQLDDRSIRDAWHKQCEQYQLSGNTARVFGASDNGNETLQYGGPVSVARDPSGTSTYTHWDYTKP